MSGTECPSPKNVIRTENTGGSVVLRRGIFSR